MASETEQKVRYKIVQEPHEKLKFLTVLPGLAFLVKVAFLCQTCRFCPGVPVHKSRYKGPNNIQQLTNDS